MNEERIREFASQESTVRSASPDVLRTKLAEGYPELSPLAGFGICQEGLPESACADGSQNLVKNLGLICLTNGRATGRLPAGFWCVYAVSLPAYPCNGGTPWAPGSFSLELFFAHIVADVTVAAPEPELSRPSLHRQADVIGRSVRSGESGSCRSCCFSWAMPVRAPGRR